MRIGETAQPDPDADSTRLWCSLALLYYPVVYDNTSLFSIFEVFFFSLCLDNAVIEMRKIAVYVLASASEYAGGVFFAVQA